LETANLKKPQTMSIKDLKHAIIVGENENAVKIAGTLIKRGVKPEEIVINGVTKAMEHLDKKCTVQNFCLLELMLAGRAAMDVIDHLCSEEKMNADILLASKPFPRQKIILGTIKGDIHEIGKNIFSMIMKSYGYRIIDMGKDVDPANLVMRAIDHKADIIAVSSLITTTIPNVRKIRKYATEQGNNKVKIIAGGAALRQSSTQYLNVDYVAETVFDGHHYIKSL